MKDTREKSRGMILIVVLACLAVFGVLLITGVKLALSAQRVARSGEWSVQARCLADSALNRAAAKLSADADYAGETWRLSAEELGGEDAGIVKIEVKTLPDQANRRLVHIEADYPDDPQDRVRYVKETSIELLAGAVP
jgi:Tfp pilus assembly protein PilX